MSLRDGLIREIEVLDDATMEMLRRRSPAERVAMVAQGWCLARALLTAQIHSRHPDWSDAEVDAEVSRRMLRGST